MILPELGDLKWKQLRTDTKTAVVRLALREGADVAAIATRFGATKAAISTHISNHKISARDSVQAIEIESLRAAETVRVKRLPGARENNIHRAKFLLDPQKQAQAEERLENSGLLGRFKTTEPASRFVELIDLGPCDCRWPFEVEGKTMFCGAKKAEGSSYCSEHRRRSFGGWG